MWFLSTESESRPTAPTPLSKQPYLPPLAILAVVTLVGALTFLGPVVKPVLVAVFLFFMIQPAAQWLIDRGLSSWVSYLILFFCVFISGALLVRVTYSNLYDLQSRLPQYEERAIELLSQVPGLDAEQFRRPLPPRPVDNTAPAALEHKPTVAPVSAAALSTAAEVVPPTITATAPTTQSAVTPIPATAPSTSVEQDSPDQPLTPEFMPDPGAELVEFPSDLPPGMTPDSGEHSAAAPASPPHVTPEDTKATSAFEFPKVTVVPELPPEEKLESKTIFELFNVTSEAIGHLILGTAVEWLEAGLMVLFYLIFVILDAHRLPNRIRRALPETGEQVVEMGRDINQSITNYMQIKTLVSLGMALTGAMLMALFRLDNWPLWALLMFLFNYITYVGSLGALVPPMVIAFLQFDSLLTAFALVILLGANRFFWIDYVEIRYAGKRLSINAVLLLMSLAYWGRYWGVTGLVLAVPMLTALKIALEKFPSTRNWATLISED